MGAQKRGEVDISRGESAIAASKMSMSAGVVVLEVAAASGSSGVDVAGKADAGATGDVTSRPDEVMEEAAPAPEEVTVVNAVPAKLVGVVRAESPNGGSEVDQRLTMAVTKSNGVDNGSSRKRKKTIHYMNSRVPHSRVVPAFYDVDAAGGSDGEVDGAADVVDLHAAPPVMSRPTQQSAATPRAAATKLKSMVPVGDKLLKAPRNAKELMATRLLEGHFVRCSCRGIQLTGMLKDMGVQCDCRNCRGSVIVSISAFEAHSGSTSHHPSDNIYLENGKNLRDVLSLGQEAADCGDNILRALKMAIGDVNNLQDQRHRPIHACAKCAQEVVADQLVPCKGHRCTLVFHAGCVGSPNAHLGDFVCSKCEKSKRPVAKAVRSRPAVEKEDVSARVKQKDLARVTRDAHLHKVLFLPGGVKDGTELGYYTQTTCKLKGVKQGEGILCSCCQKVISCAEFEQHAGCEARQNPYGSIMLMTDGRSLKDVCKDLIQQTKGGEKAKRVALEVDLNCCYDCGKSGELKCNLCNQAWCAEHQGGEKDSDGKWLCRFCQMDTLKVVKNGQRALTSKPTDQLEVLKDERGRTIRHLQAPASAGGCAICKKWSVSETTGFVQGMTMLVCDQCGREYHDSCLKGSGAKDLNELPEGLWFCRKDCQVIDEILTQLVANGPESLSDSIISELLESRHHQQQQLQQEHQQQQQQGDSNGGGGAKEKPETSMSSSPSFGWQILRGKAGSTANVMTLAEAVNIFTECSDPIIDARTGKNLIPPMVHSRRLKDYDFEGVFCVVLKLNEKVVSAALLQIFGRDIAEVPLVATSLPHQGQGLCKALMTTIERLLGVLSVERLVLPTAKDTESIWVDKFGFRRMDQDKLAAICTTVRLMTFTGTCMLGKEIVPMTV